MTTVNIDQKLICEREIPPDCAKQINQHHFGESNPEGNIVTGNVVDVTLYEIEEIMDILEAHNILPQEEQDWEDWIGQHLPGNWPEVLDRG